MRTKTILLSAILAVICSVSAKAQVFSINAVGYINLVIPNGFSIIANQLDSTNNNFSPLLDAQLLAQAGNWDGLTFFKYANGGYTTLIVDDLGSPTPPWDPVIVGGVVTSDPATNTSLNPGEAAFVNNNTGAPITLTFVGSVRQGSLTNMITSSLTTPEYSMISSQVPQAGRLDLDLSMTEVDGDFVYIYNNTGNPATTGYQTYIGDSLGSPSGWDYDPSTPSNPTVAVGQGFFYLNNAEAPEQWVRSFSIN